MFKRLLNPWDTCLVSLRSWCVVDRLGMKPNCSCGIILAVVKIGSSLCRMIRSYIFPIVFRRLIGLLFYGNIAGFPGLGMVITIACFHRVGNTWRESALLYRFSK